MDKKSKQLQELQLQPQQQQQQQRNKQQQRQQQQQTADKVERESIEPIQEPPPVTETQSAQGRLKRPLAERIREGVFNECTEPTDGDQLAPPPPQRNCFEKKMVIGWPRGVPLPRKMNMGVELRTHENGTLYDLPVEDGKVEEDR